MMLKRSPIALKGNDRFEGFCIDLLREISQQLGFDYRIELVPDGAYGYPNKEDGEWNGMVKQIMDKVGAIVVAHLSISILLAHNMPPVQIRPLFN